MNLPNKLTLLRMIAVPIFVLLAYLAKFNTTMYIWALIVFLLAALTDWFDGYLARRDGIVTKFGILMDPLADKLLVSAAMICFVDMAIVPAWVVIVVISREFLVTSIRLVAASDGKVIAADKMGKYKTAVQMIWICLGIFLSAFVLPLAVVNILEIIYNILMVMVLLLTVISGLNYVMQNKDCFSQ